VLNGDVVNEVSRLKRELTGTSSFPASFQLVRALTEHDLVDELWLKIYAVVLEAGERLFGETSEKKPMHLLSTQIVGTASPTSSTSASETPSSCLRRLRLGRTQ
jgi:dihydrofolate reductase